MADRLPLRQDAALPRQPADPAPVAKPDDARAQPSVCADAMLCDRCGAGMFRMHAVWRCPECGYKTDCCGW